MSNHTNLSLHLGDASLTKIDLFSLPFCLLLQVVDSLKKLLFVVALLPDVGLHLLVVSIDFWVDLIVHIFDFLDELVHKAVHLISQLV